MLKIFFDHDFDHHILRGLEKRIANLDYVTPNILNNSPYANEENLNDFQDVAQVYATAYYFSFIIFSLTTGKYRFFNKKSKNKDQMRKNNSGA